MMDLSVICKILQMCKRMGNSVVFNFCFVVVFFYYYSFLFVCLFLFFFGGGGGGGGC